VEPGDEKEIIMLVQDVMTTTPVSATPTTTVAEAFRLLDAYRITSMPVVDGLGCVIGILSEADLLRDTLSRDVQAGSQGTTPQSSAPPVAVAGDLMTHEVVGAEATTELLDAISLMVDSKVKSLPVLSDDGRLVGMVSRRDVVHAVAHTDEAVRSELEAALLGLGLDWWVSLEKDIVVVHGPAFPAELAVAERLASDVVGARHVRIVED